MASIAKPETTPTLTDSKQESYILNNTTLLEEKNAEVDLTSFSLSQIRDSRIPENLSNPVPLQIFESSTNLMSVLDLNQKKGTLMNRPYYTSKLQVSRRHYW